jgi:hypothetical protein
LPQELETQTVHLLNASPRLRHKNTGHKNTRHKNLRLPRHKYLELSGARIPVKNHVRTAAMYLEGNAKLWYMNTYASMTPKPTLDVFLREFKLQHTRTNNDSDIANQLETIRQGNKSVADYAMEFKAEDRATTLRLTLLTPSGLP